MTKRVFWFIVLVKCSLEQWGNGALIPTTLISTNPFVRKRMEKRKEENMEKMAEKKKRALRKVERSMKSIEEEIDILKERLDGYNGKKLSPYKRSCILDRIYYLNTKSLPKKKAIREKIKLELGLMT